MSLKRKIYRKKWYRRNKSKHNENCRIWNKKNKKKKLALNMKRTGCILPPNFDYNKLLKSQNGRCKLCSIHHSKYSKSLSVDHNHTTGKVRGLLCFRCNMGIGYFKENILTLKNAVKYLS